MPFDAMNTGPVTLTGYLESVGITPVPLVYWRQHKDEQIRLNPPNPLTTGKPYFMVALVVPALLMLAAHIRGLPVVNDMAFFVFMSLMAGATAACLLFMAVSLYSNGTGRALRGRVHWVENYAASYNDTMIPEPIREIVQRVRMTKPANVTLIYGELRRREVVLDPYIVLDMQGQRACLGIWDGKRVIACANME